MKKKILFALFVILIASMLFVITSGAEGQISAGDSDITLDELIVFKGYSVRENDTGAICSGYEIDYDKLAEYQEQTGKTLDFGIVFAGYDNLKGSQPINSDGTVITLEKGKVIKQSLASLNYPNYDFILNDITDAIKDTLFVINAYIYDGEAVKYCTPHGISNASSAISYNEIIGSTVTYDANGGYVAQQTQRLVYGKEYNLATPTRSGCTFYGWYYGDESIPLNGIWSMNEDITLTAKWSYEADNGVVYLFSDSEATVIGYNGAIGVNFTIPATVSGYEVTAIGPSAFKGYGSKLEAQGSYGSSFPTITIPSTITVIGENAFDDCNDLKIQLANGSNVSEWAENVTVESGNKHVLDVIKGKRPAIGWSGYVIL